MDNSFLTQFLLLNKSNSSNSDNVLYTILFLVFQVILMSSIKNIEKVLNTVFTFIEEYIKKSTDIFLNKTTNKIESIVKNNMESQIIKDEYLINDIINEHSLLIDYVANLDKDQKTSLLHDQMNTNYRYLKYLFGFIIKLNHIGCIEITRYEMLPLLIDKKIELVKDIYCVINKLDICKETSAISKCKLKIFSNKFNINYIYKFLQKLEQEQIDKNSLLLSDDIYYFDCYSANNNAPNRMRDAFETEEEYSTYMLRYCEPQLCYTKKIYKTNRDFNNIIGDKTRQIYKKVKFFCENKDWYDSKGIPYHLGILLSGIPGSGKSSTIKAIANFTKRHIINVNIKKLKTVMQLKNLFLNENIETIDPHTNKKELIKLPIENRLYILEEIDLLGNIVLDRKLNKIKEQSENDLQISLADILTILDGTVETPGRIIVCTSNYPEKLDKALLRGGRMDLLVKFTNCKVSEIHEYLKFFFDIEDSEYSKDYSCLFSKEFILDSNGNTYLTYADLSQSAFSNTLSECINYLYEKNEEKYKISLSELEYCNVDSEIEDIKDTEDKIKICKLQPPLKINSVQENAEYFDQKNKLDNELSWVIDKHAIQTGFNQTETKNNNSSTTKFANFTEYSNTIENNDSNTTKFVNSKVKKYDASKLRPLE